MKEKYREIMNNYKSPGMRHPFIFISPELNFLNMQKHNESIIFNNTDWLNCNTSIHMYCDSEVYIYNIYTEQMVVYSQKHFFDKRSVRKRFRFKYFPLSLRRSWQNQLIINVRKI